MTLYRILTLSLILTTACKRAPDRADPESGAVVARFANRHVTLQELDQRIAHGLFEQRSAALYSYIFEELLTAEALRRTISVSELLQQEVDATSPEIAPEELRAAYEQAVLANAVSVDTPYAEVESGLLSRLREARRQASREALRDRLFQASRVRLDLQALGRPKPKLRTDRPSAGASNPVVWIHEYTDFTSPFCARANSTLKRVLEEFGSSVRVVFKQNPRADDGVGAAAAEAALCANDQAKYLAYRQRLFERQGTLDREAIVSAAEEAGLDATKFKICLDSGKNRHTVLEDRAEATQSGLEGSPVFSVNGTRLSGAHSFDMFARLIRLEVQAQDG